MLTDEEGIVSTDTIAAQKYTVADAVGIQTAPIVWQVMHTQRIPSLIESFDRDGFCIIKGAIPPQQVQALRTEYERLAATWQETIRDYGDILGTSHDGFDKEPKQDGRVDQPVFRKIGRPCLISEPYRRLLEAPAVVELLRSLIGERVCLFRDVIYPKAARVAREKPWHHDQAYWKWEPAGAIVQTMTALDPHGLHNGCLQVVPGSHKQSWAHATTGEKSVSLPDEIARRAVSLVLDPGDTLVFSSLLLHASAKNTSADDRCVVYIAYCPKSLHYAGEGAATSCVPLEIPADVDRIARH
jgi:phytanoyl-CoA hydroxylase